MTTSLTLTATRTVTLTRTQTLTRTPSRTATTVPGNVVINEFLPHPHTDWNGDGLANTGDEYIELINLGTASISLRNWKLDNGDGSSSPYTLPDMTLLPRQMAVFYHTASGIPLSDGGDTVRLLKPDGRTADIFTYPVVTSMDRTWCRLPDGSGTWAFACRPTPGKPNVPVAATTPGAVSTPAAGTDEEAGAGCRVASAPPVIRAAECSSPGTGMWGEQEGGQTWLERRWKWDVFVE